MNCNDYKRWFSPYVDGLLKSEERAQFEVHLRECAHCSTDLQSLQQMLQALKTMEQPEVPNLLPAIHEQLEREPVWRALVRRLLAPWPQSLPIHGLALATTVLLVVVVTAVPRYFGSREYAARGKGGAIQLARALEGRNSEIVNQQERPQGQYEPYYGDASSRSRLDEAKKEPAQLGGDRFERFRDQEKPFDKRTQLAADLNSHLPTEDSSASVSALNGERAEVTLKAGIAQPGLTEQTYRQVTSNVASTRGSELDHEEVADRRIAGGLNDEAALKQSATYQSIAQSGTPSFSKTLRSEERLAASPSVMTHAEVAAQTAEAGSAGGGSVSQTADGVATATGKPFVAYSLPSAKGEGEVGAVRGAIPSSQVQRPVKDFATAATEVTEWVPSQQGMMMVQDDRHRTTQLASSHAKTSSNVAQEKGDANPSLSEAASASAPAMGEQIDAASTPVVRAGPLQVHWGVSDIGQGLAQVIEWVQAHGGFAVATNDHHVSIRLTAQDVPEFLERFSTEHPPFITDQAPSLWVTISLELLSGN